MTCPGEDGEEGTETETETDESKADDAETRRGRDDLGSYDAWC